MHDEIKRRSLLAAVPAMFAPRSVNAAAAEPFSPGYPGTQFYDEQEQKELTEALESRTLNRWYGPKTPGKVARFEEEFGKFMGARYALATTSGTAALHVALTALGVGPGDEVILPSWTWYSCYNTIVLTGALPVFAEVNESFTMDPADMERKITPRTKAIMVVHLYGCPADLDPILAIARKHKLRVLEDAAQSVGGRYKGARLGAIGDIGIYSFQISKVITAGEGGAVVTSDAALFERATRFHDLGMLRPGHEAVLGKASLGWFAGANYRMNEMTGAVMRAQLRKLDSIIGVTRRHATSLREQIGNLPGLKPRRLPDPAGDIGLWVYAVLPAKEMRDKFVAALRKEKIPASRPSGSLPLPAVSYIENKVAMHPEWPSFSTPRGKAIRYGAECCPRTIELFDRAAAIDIGPRYTEDGVKEIVAAVRKAQRTLFG